jgi:hypothetical protein
MPCVLRQPQIISTSNSCPQMNLRPFVASHDVPPAGQLFYMPAQAERQSLNYGYVLAMRSIPRHFWAALAQSVEHIIRNDGVRCSNHLSGTSFFR